MTCRFCLARVCHSDNMIIKESMKITWDVVGPLQVHDIQIKHVIDTVNLDKANLSTQ